jgi:hypothetical protein
MGDNSQLIIVLALLTLTIGVAAGLVMRIRVAQKKGDPARSSFVRDHGGAPRPNRPGTEH